MALGAKFPIQSGFGRQIFTPRVALGTKFPIQSGFGGQNLPPREAWVALGAISHPGWLWEQNLLLRVDLGGQIFTPKEAWG